MPPTVPATGVPGSATDVPDSGFTATPVPFGSVPSAATYTVQEGDTLVSIAERYFYDVAELIRLNGLRVDADLFVGQQLILPETSGMSNSLATATPVPFTDVIQLVPTFPPFVGSEMEPPMIWVPGNGNISAPNSSGLVVAIPSARLRPMELAAEITEGQIVNLYTTLSLSTDGSDDAAGGFNTAMVSVAASTQVISVNDAGTIAVWVPLEQGIVLTWLLNDTPAAITYEQAEQ
jgi:LysM repeat protein